MSTDNIHTESQILRSYTLVFVALRLGGYIGEWKNSMEATTTI